MNEVKYALVTGASRGIGRAIALKLASQGFSTSEATANAIRVERLLLITPVITSAEGRWVATIK